MTDSSFDKMWRDTRDTWYAFGQGFAAGIFFSIALFLIGQAISDSLIEQMKRTKPTVAQAEATK